MQWWNRFSGTDSGCRSPGKITVRAMKIKRDSQLLLVVCAAVLVFGLSGAFSLQNNEASALLAFRSKLSVDPLSVLAEWGKQDVGLCHWRGVTCSNGRVTRLELANLSLRGIISPEVSRLYFLEKIDLRGNNLSGTIPKELWTLRKLHYLDLSNNHLSGSVPSDIQNLVNLRILNLAGNQISGVLPREFEKLVKLKHLRLDGNQITGSIPGLHGLCNLGELRTLNLSNNALFGKIPDCVAHHPSSSFERNCLHLSAKHPLPSTNCGGSHRTLEEKSQNNATNRAHAREQVRTHVHRQQTHVSKQDRRHSRALFALLYALPVLVACALVILVIGVFFYKRKTAAVSPWKAGMSGHLQKVFVTDVPSVSWTELQSACEDFSNIIGSSPDSVVFKGTLSNGTEVAVTSIRISAASWSASSEIFFRRKIEALARMKHTHLVNLLGYCAEEEPFARMLLFEYAPNGTLFEHLHNEDSEHLDWPTRMRIIMGAGYGLEYMHHELVPPASHSNFDSNAIYLTEDYAAKIADFGISRLAVLKSDRRKSFSNSIGYDDFEGSDRHAPDFESNIFSFGLFLLEIVTGRLPYTEKDGSLLEWALEFLSSSDTVGYMVDSSLKNFDLKQLLVICEVVRLCIQPDSSKRPTMKNIISMLAKGLNMSPESARPKCSPLLWAELEILSP